MSDASFLITIVLVTSVGIFGSRLSEMYSFPKTTVLIILGILIGLIGNFDPSHLIDIGLIKDGSLLILELALVVVLFHEGIRLNLNNFKKHIFSILLIAIVGTLFTTILVGFSLLFFVPLSSDLIFYPFLLAAIFSPSDPSSTFAILRGGTTRVNEKIETIIEGESALNDIIAILLVVIILIPAVVEHGIDPLFISSVNILINALWQSLGGVIFGLIIGLISILLIQKSPNSIEQSLISLSAVLILFSLGILLHVSTAIAALIAGMVLGNLNIFKIERNLVTDELTSFWEYLTYLFEMLAFILIGISLSLSIFIDEPIITIISLIISIIVIGGRIAGIFITTAPLKFFKNYEKEFNNKEKLFVGFTGMKGLTTGVLSMIAFIEFSKVSYLIKIAEILLYSSILVIIFTGIIQAVFLKKLAKRTGVLANFEIDDLDMIKGQKLVLNSTLDFIKDEIKEKNLELGNLGNISIPLREELYSIREHLSRMKSEQLKDLKSLQFDLKLNKIARNTLLDSLEKEELKDFTYKKILIKLKAEEININLYIKNIESNEKVDTINEVNYISEDLDSIENEITLIESKNLESTAHNSK